jgi:dihydroxy-acid dehydratase
MDPRHKSRAILEGPDRAPARTYFKAVGYTDEDLARPLVGVAHCWIELTPCTCWRSTPAWCRPLRRGP